MIIYGTKATLLKTELLHMPCPNCSRNYSIQMSVFQKYAHIFWIPCFPLGKTGVSVCENCRQVLKLKNMPDSLKHSYDDLASQSKPPLWTFSGLGIVAIIVAAVAINDANETKATNQYVMKPQAGDVMKVKLDSAYTLFKIINVDKDSIRFVMDKYQTDDESGLDDLGSKGYDTDKYVMSRTKLAEMNKNGKLVGMERN